MKENASVLSKIWRTNAPYIKVGLLVLLLVLLGVCVYM